MKAAKDKALSTVKVEITFEPVTPAQRQAWAKAWSRLLAGSAARTTSGNEDLWNGDTGEHRTQGDHPPV